MKTFLKILAGLVVLGVVAFVLVMALTSGARDTAKAFVIESSSGEYTAARARLHEALAAEFTEARFAEVFQGARAYTEVSFSSVEASGGTTTLEGTAETADGCSSKVALEVLDGQIISFDITPLCRN
jgi:hypothetical protein